MGDQKHEVLNLPDPLASLSAEERLGFDWMRSELETVFKKYVEQGQIVFRAMPSGNEHVLRGFSTHFVIDSNIVCSQLEVHKRLAASLGSDYECQESCQCQRRVLTNSTTDHCAVKRQVYQRAHFAHCHGRVHAGPPPNDEPAELYQHCQESCC